MSLARSSLVVLVLALMPALPGQGADFVVNSVGDLRSDTNPGDGVCADSEGVCTLGTAIEEANAWPGPDSVTLIPGTSLVDGAWPSVRDDLVIRGVPGSEIEGATGVRGARLVVQDVELWTGFLSAVDAELILIDTHFSWGNIRLHRSFAEFTGFSHGSAYDQLTFLTAEDSDLVLSEAVLHHCGIGFFEEPALTVMRGSLQLLDSEVRGCPPAAPRRDWRGGGVSVTGASVRVERSVFRQLGFGGAGLQVFGAPQVVVVDSSFVGNNTTGLRVDADRIEVTGTRFEGHRPYWYGQTESHPSSGGAASLKAPQVLVSDCRVIGNSAIGDGPSEDVGAGLKIDSADAVIEDSLIRDNVAWASHHLGFRDRVEAEARGGGLFLTGASLVQRCRIEANAATHGAGISNAGILLLRESVVAGNGPAEGSVLPNQGAGLYNAAGSATVVNTTITDNVADGAAEILAAAGLVRLLHATVAHEDAPEGPPIEVRAGADFLARDTILAGGRPQACEGTVIAESGLLVQHPGACDLVGPAGSLILEVDPLLGPLTLLSGSPARSPGPGSPAIDAAGACRDEDELPQTRDQRGDPRPEDGDADGIADCDLGAVEVCFDPLDSDGDGIGDGCDRCPEHADPLQGDADGDGIGDACDLEEVSALDLDPSAEPLLVSAGGFVTWETTDEPSWVLAQGHLEDLATLGLSGSLDAMFEVPTPRHRVTAPGSYWVLAAGRRGPLTSSFGRDGLGDERPLP
jgi:hypothetical protein